MGRFFCICLAEIQMSNIIVTCEDTMGKCKSFIAESHAAAADMIPVHTAIVHSLLVLSVGRSTKDTFMKSPEVFLTCLRDLANPLDGIYSLVSASKYRVAKH